MTLPHDYKDINHRLYSTLNEDVQLKSDEYGRWDLDFFNGDIVYVDGLKSLENACIIAIMTRYNELEHNPLYKDFGCRIHELVKENQSLMVEYKIKEFIQDTLKKMRRIKKVNWVEVKVSKQDTYKYDVSYSITSIDDGTIVSNLSL
jgi:phage gp46-like protein